MSTTDYTIHALAAALRLCSSRLALHAVHGNLDAINAADAALALLDPPPAPRRARRTRAASSRIADPEPKRTAFIVHAVAQARAFNRSVVRMLREGNAFAAGQARSRRNEWLKSARTAKAGAK
jgi:hypothetical protein